MLQRLAKKLLSSSTSQANIDWARVLKHTPPKARAKVLAVRAQHEDLLRTLGETKQQLAKYSDESWVERYREAGLDEKAIKESMNEMEALEEQKSKAMAESKLFIQGLETELRSLEDQIAALQMSKPLDQLTVDDVYAKFPHWRDDIYADIERGNWDPAAEDEKPAAKKNHRVE